MQHSTETSDIEMTDAVLEVSLSANKQLVQELKGDGNMFESLMELMEPQIQMLEKRVGIKDKDKVSGEWWRCFGNSDIKIPKSKP